MSVIGFDNNATSCFVQPSIASVEQNPSALGEQAFNLILEQIREPQIRQENILLEQEIVLRESMMLEKKYLEEMQLPVYKGK